MQFSQALFKFDNPHGYWFINPHTGDRHMQLMPDAGYGDRTADVARQLRWQQGRGIRENKYRVIAMFRKGLVLI